MICNTCGNKFICNRDPLSKNFLFSPKCKQFDNIDYFVELLSDYNTIFSNWKDVIDLINKSEDDYK